MNRVLWWVNLAALAALATICALIATAPVPPSDEWVPMTAGPAVPYIESEQP